MVGEIQNVQFTWSLNWILRFIPSLHFSSTMSHLTPPQPAKHTSMELDESAIDVVAVDSAAAHAAAHAAAALASLSADLKAEEADVGQSEADMKALPPRTTAHSRTV
jgi:hypothetical protein